MKHGLANIPLILGLLLIVAITPLAIRQVQQNQNPQNRAYEDTYSLMPCNVLAVNITQYCPSSTNNLTPVDSVPCNQAQTAYNTYCTIMSVTTPTSIPSICKTGQTKCVGRYVFVCKNQAWVMSRVCNGACQNNVCIEKDY